MSVLRLRRDRRQRDPFGAAPITQAPACRACSPMDYGKCACRQYCGWLSCMGQRPEEPLDPRTRETLERLIEQARTEQADNPGVMPAPPVVADYKALPAYRDAIHAACAAGLRNLGTRGLPVPPLPDYDLGRFTVQAADDDFGPEFDRVAEHYEAGFVQARRVFHSADTAGFPAVNQ